jgi:hypothetical protein
MNASTTEIDYELNDLSNEPTYWLIRQWRPDPKETWENKVWDSKSQTSICSQCKRPTLYSGNGWCSNCWKAGLTKRMPPMRVQNPRITAELESRCLKNGIYVDQNGQVAISTQKADLGEMMMLFTWLICTQSKINTEKPMLGAEELKLAKIIK